jgi:hypothetical protein
MQFLVGYFTVHDRSTRLRLSQGQQAEFYAQNAILLSAWIIVYATELFFVSTVKLLVLFRTMELSVPQGEAVPHHWERALRMVMKAVAGLNIVGLSASIAAAVYGIRSASFYSSAAAAYATNSSDCADDCILHGDQIAQISFSAGALQAVCEVLVLLLIILAFAVAGSAFVRYAAVKLRDLESAARGDALAIRRVDPHTAIRSEQESMAAAASTVIAGSRMRLQVTSTAAIVFVTFLLRAVYSTMFGVANAFQNTGADCGIESASICNAECYNVYALIQKWMVFTPEFQLMVVLISSPLALLVALWGMTNDAVFKAMRISSLRMTSMRDRMLLPEAD